MDCLWEDTIFISSLKEAQDLALLLRAGITHILTIGPDMPPLFSDFLYEICVVDDDLHAVIYAEFRRCFSFIDAALAQGGKVLVHCEAGMSRSATICIGYLMHKSRAAFLSVLDDVKRIRPKINPNQCFLQQLQLLERSQFNLDPNDAAIAESLAAIERERMHKPSVVHADVFLDPTESDRRTSTAVDDVIPQLVEIISKSQNVIAEEPFHSEGETTEDEAALQTGSQPPAAAKCDIDVPLKSTSQTPDTQASPVSAPDALLPRLKPRSSSASFPKSETGVEEEESGGAEAEKNLGLNRNLLESETDEACPKENAAMVVERVLLGYTPTNKDEQKVSDFLATTEIPPVASKAFTGLRQALRMMKKVVCRGDEVSSHVEGLRRSLRHVSGQLERYTGYPMNSAAFVELLRSSDGLQVVLDRIEQEYNSALEAIRQEKLSAHDTESSETHHHSDPRRAFSRALSNPTSRDTGLAPVPMHRIRSTEQSNLPEGGERENGKSHGPRRATIEMLLLFAKLGLRRSIREDLSDRAYANLSQMLEGGSREKAALETIDQGSLIELLRYLDLNSPKENEIGLKRLAHVCEARLILMVEVNTAAPIFDALIALPRVRGAIRRVATYALHFSGAIIGTRLAMSQPPEEIQVARSLSTSPYEVFDASASAHDKKSIFGVAAKALAHSSSGWSIRGAEGQQHSILRRGSDWVQRLWNSHSNDPLGKHPQGLPLKQGATISTRKGKPRRRFFRSKKPQERVLQTMEQFDPVMAMRGLLKHVSTVAGTRVGAHGGCPMKKLQQLKEHALELSSVHPFICVADNEQRPGLRDLPKASTMLEQNLKITRYSSNQTRKCKT